jgi:hypothetical protein
LLKAKNVVVMVLIKRRTKPSKMMMKKKWLLKRCLVIWKICQREVSYCLKLSYIDAMELKRMLDCLGLDKGWDMNTIERMVMVVVLSFCGKVDFGEFELMIG